MTLDLSIQNVGVEPRVSIDAMLGDARTGKARTSRSRKTRAGLITAVRDELNETGSFTADSVAERAGCSSATFYGHFATKDDALASAFELVLVEMSEMVESIFTADELASAGLAITIELWTHRQVDFFRDESLVFRAALARLPFHRGIRHAYREADRVSLSHLVDLITAGQAAGLVRIGAPTELAEAFLVLSQGLNNPHVLYPESTNALRHLQRAMLATLELPKAQS